VRWPSLDPTGILGTRLARFVRGPFLTNELAVNPALLVLTRLVLLAMNIGRDAQTH